MQQGANGLASRGSRRGEEVPSGEVMEKPVPMNQRADERDTNFSPSRDFTCDDTNRFRDWNLRLDPCFHIIAGEMTRRWSRIVVCVVSLEGGIVETRQESETHFL